MSNTHRDEAQIERLLAEMTLAEKVTLCHANSTFCSGGNERLGIHELTMSDGPHGVRAEVSRTSWRDVDDADDEVTALPPASTLAATWNRECARLFGTTLGAEARARGKDVILGPGVNLIRTPLCGRNFEYFSEDPYLTAELAVPCVEEIQTHDVAACVKHYALNNQELNRNRVNVLVEDDVLFELYLYAFRETVQRAHALTFMGAYNQYRGTHCCHNHRLVREILKDGWGFDGAYISDWGGTHDTEEAARNGLDIEMGGGSDFENYHLARPYLQALEAGTLPVSDLDDKVRRILCVMLRIGMLDPARSRGAKNTPAHQAHVRRIAEEGIVLLKNNGLLPLPSKTLRTVAVIGENGALRHAQGGGSSAVKALYEITPLEGLREALGDGVEVRYEEGYPSLIGDIPPIPAQFLSAADLDTGVRGWRGYVYDNHEMQGEPVAILTSGDMQASYADAPAPEAAGTRWAVRWETTLTPPETGTYTLVVEGTDCTQLQSPECPDVSISIWGDTVPVTHTASVELTAGQPVTLVARQYPHRKPSVLRVGWYRPGEEPTRDTEKVNAALAAAADADAVVFVGGLTHRLDTEGMDKKELTLPGGQDEFIEQLLAARPDTVVVLVGGSAVTMPWLDKARAVVWTGYGGSEAGRALAGVLLGTVNPSGKLPYSFPVSLAEAPAHKLGEYEVDEETYRDGHFIGYRYFVTKKETPLFPFGHGLSYTAFAYDTITLTQDAKTIRVRVTITNTGTRDGAEVVQAYIGYDAETENRPTYALRGFEKVTLAAGASVTVAMTIPLEALAIYDLDTSGWRLRGGAYTAYVGASSMDIRGTCAFTVPEGNVS